MHFFVCTAAQDQDHLNRLVVYNFDVLVRDQVDQKAMLGIDLIIPVDIRLDSADGRLCLPDEVRINLAVRRPPYARRYTRYTWTINSIKSMLVDR